MVEVQPLQNDRYRAFMSPAEYQRLLNSIPSYASRPPFQLMALSLRVGTASEVTPGQIYKKNGEYFMKVEGKDASERYQETKPRNIWIPHPIYKQIGRYIENQNRGEDEPICGVGKRQLQNWVATAAENAATSNDDNSFNKVTAHDLRRFFATHFLIRLGIHPQIVTQLGGWQSPENMFEYLLFPNDLLVHHLTKQGYTGTNPLRISGTDPVGELNANFDAIEKILTEGGSDVKGEIAERMENIAQEISWLEISTIPSAHKSESDATVSENTDQSSLTGAFDRN